MRKFFWENSNPPANKDLALLCCKLARMSASVQFNFINKDLSVNQSINQSMLPRHLRPHFIEGRYKTWIPLLDSPFFERQSSKPSIKVVNCMYFRMIPAAIKFLDNKQSRELGEFE